MTNTDPISSPDFPFGREFAHEQALASARIEGFQPDAAFDADYAELLAGRLSGEEFRARAAARALRNGGGQAAGGGEVKS